ncbi:MAG TPA: YegP family protein [Streptosporangiaceae bacterium]
MTDDLVEEDDMAGKFVLKKDAGGQFRFNLVASNGQVIASSEAYTTKSAALNGIDSVKRHAADAETDDQTD